MNRHVNAIAGRLSLRPPQRHSLEILDRVTEIVGLGQDIDCDAALAAIPVISPGSFLSRHAASDVGPCP